MGIEILTQPHNPREREVLTDETTKFFTPTAVATSHFAITACVEECFRSSDTGPRQKRKAFAELLDEKFREIFEIDHGLSREDEYDLHRIWDALLILWILPRLCWMQP